MICEPFIKIAGPTPGDIKWFNMNPYGPGALPAGHEHEWMSYADFERSKLIAMKARTVIRLTGDGYRIDFIKDSDSPAKKFYSKFETGYDTDRYASDNERQRLWERVRFVKAICEKRGVPWIPATGGIVTDLAPLPDQEPCCLVPSIAWQHRCLECGKSWKDGEQPCWCMGEKEASPRSEGIDIVQVLCEEAKNLRADDHYAIKLIQEKWGPKEVSKENTWHMLTEAYLAGKRGLPNEECDDDLHFDITKAPHNPFSDKLNCDYPCVGRCQKPKEGIDVVQVLVDPS